MLTYVLVAVAVGTFVAAWQSGRRDLRRLALVIALGIPAQAVIGGITVLTDLNPWIVSFHLLCSMAIIGVAVLFLHRVEHPAPAVRPRGALLGLAWATFAAAWAVLYVGTDRDRLRPARRRRRTPSATGWTRCSGARCTPTWCSCSSG